MAAFPHDIVGFDLDGTLFDTSADLAAALNHVLHGLERPPLSRAQVTSMVGEGTRRMLAKGLEASGDCTPELVDRSYPQLMGFYEAHLTAGTRPYPGLVAALDGLAEAGATLAVVTNKVEHLAVRLLADMGLADRFATVIGGDTVGEGKPSPLPILEMIRRCGGGRAAFVGDSRFDVEAARNAGVPVVAVSFGFLGHGVHDLNPDAVIDHFVELVPALTRLGQPNHRSTA
ncbi:HAD-IA family hydrolase [Sphingomonas xinjiangensis]|uniref:Phosphoglycolate phosphatase n=1 Tax=Sphingomonas xinjiangensis TaxID=643568 RepID=A0A840YB22_9SPHN|nr:HAD-IA family hydrolase [Sphingomonas xinjiangensis]MBB5710537.1 phosphoglycolate phosphatase [Sphingomonas xinjiangensis]